VSAFAAIEFAPVHDRLLRSFSGAPRAGVVIPHAFAVMQGNPQT